MRRAIFYFLIFLLGIVIQFGWIRYFSPFGLSPNLILVMIVFIGIREGAFAGQLFGFAWGLSWDVLSISLFGSHAFLFTCLGYLSGQLSRKWNESKIITQLLLVGLSSLFFFLGMNLINRIFAPGEFKSMTNYILIFQPFYNMLVAPVVFWVGDRVMEYIDGSEF